MDDRSTGHRHWNDEAVAFEAWKHHASVGGADKDRMIQIASLLLGFSAAIVGFTFKEGVGSHTIGKPVAVVALALAGIIVSTASALIALLYGGYANRNWAKADQIASDYGWTRLDPNDSPFPSEETATGRPPRRVAWALHQSAPKPSHEQLAPVFDWFFGLSLASVAMHLLILFWGILTLSVPITSRLLAWLKSTLP